MNTSIGLKERIAHAENETEIIQLLASGNDLKYASPRTKLSWKHTAQRRICQLQKEKLPVETIEKLPVSNKKKIKGKNTYLNK
jgi:hypothetical protein